jgi:two-component system response regulator NreC
VPKVKVMLADDHQIVRQGLRALLETEPDMAVVGEVSEGLTVADMVTKLSPDVLVLDLMMPGLNGLEVTRQVSQRSPNVRIIVLSMHANEAYVLEALRNGAAGYVLKESSTETLVTAIRTTMEGRRYLCAPLSEMAMEAFLQKAQNVAVDPYDSLTGREREVLQLAAEGHTNMAIADRLSISPRTAEVHRSRIMEKLQLTNQTALIKYAIRKGLLSVEN